MQKLDKSGIGMEKEQKKYKYCPHNKRIEIFPKEPYYNVQGKPKQPCCRMCGGESRNDRDSSNISKSPNRKQKQESSKATRFQKTILKVPKCQEKVKVENNIVVHKNPYDLVQSNEISSNHQKQKKKDSLVSKILERDEQKHGYFGKQQTSSIDKGILLCLLEPRKMIFSSTDLRQNLENLEEPSKHLAETTASIANNIRKEMPKTENSLPKPIKTSNKIIKKKEEITFVAKPSFAKKSNQELLNLEKTQHKVSKKLFETDPKEGIKNNDSRITSHFPQEMAIQTKFSSELSDKILKVNSKADNFKNVGNPSNAKKSLKETVTATKTSNGPAKEICPEVKKKSTKQAPIPVELLNDSGSKNLGSNNVDNPLADSFPTKETANPAKDLQKSYKKSSKAVDRVNGSKNVENPSINPPQETAKSANAKAGKSLLRTVKKSNKSSSEKDGSNNMRSTSFVSKPVKETGKFGKFSNATVKQFNKAASKGMESSNIKNPLVTKRAANVAKDPRESIKTLDKSFKKENGSINKESLVISRNSPEETSNPVNSVKLNEAFSKDLESNKGRNYPKDSTKKLKSSHESSAHRTELIQQVPINSEVEPESFSVGDPEIVNKDDVKSNLEKVELNLFQIVTEPNALVAEEASKMSLISEKDVLKQEEEEEEVLIQPQSEDENSLLSKNSSSISLGSDVISIHKTNLTLIRTMKSPSPTTIKRKKASKRKSNKKGKQRNKTSKSKTTPRDSQSNDLIKNGSKFLPGFEASGPALLKNIRINGTDVPDFDESSAKKPSKEVLFAKQPSSVSSGLSGSEPATTSYSSVLSSGGFKTSVSSSEPSSGFPNRMNRKNIKNTNGKIVVKNMHRADDKENLKASRFAAFYNRHYERPVRRNK